MNNYSNSNNDSALNGNLNNKGLALGIFKIIYYKLITLPLNAVVNVFVYLLIYHCYILFYMLLTGFIMLF